HTDEPCFYYRVSQKPGDITTLGKEIRLETANNTTYPSPFILSDDPDHIYLCWRGIGWHPTIARLTIPDKDNKVRFDWGPYQILQSQEGGRGVRPYAKYMSNKKDRIYMAYTTTHPDNQSVNYIYFNYIDINTYELKDIKGQKLARVGDETLHNVEATANYKNSYPDAVAEDSPYRNWLWEISITDEEKPVIAVVRISEDKESHDYYHVRWTGSEWRKTFLSHAGGHFHQTPGLEKCYSGGMTIDKADPSIIYGSASVEGKHGHIYELKKFTVTPEGTLASTEQLTYDSPKNNIRPFVITNEGKNPQIVWMYGDYYDWIVSSARPGYPTAIRTSMDIPSYEINMNKGLLYHNIDSTVSPDDVGDIDIPKSDKFTIIVAVSVDHDAFYGEIIKTDAFTYGLKEGEQPRPYIKVGNNEAISNNVLGNSDAWRMQHRETGGRQYAPVKPELFQLAITYEEGVVRTYIDGLADQYVEAKGLSLSEINPGGFKGAIHNIRIYNRALSQDEIKAVK
ncbi:MAG: BNR-4 repeat-containing protein, partial [Proteiniphilum sp.]|nr:BNR-4 repeat-containing protein [Proteiniphilum sp.]